MLMNECFFDQKVQIELGNLKLEARRTTARLINSIEFLPCYYVAKFDWLDEY